LSSLHIPLGLGFWETPSADELLYGTRQARLDSGGALLIVLIALGAAVAVIQPRRFSVLAGVLLATTVLVNAVMILNHPVLTELLDDEYRQRQHIARALTVTSLEGNGIVRTSNTRLGAWSSPPDVAPHYDLFHGWQYLLCGQWLIAWAGLGTFAARAGGMGRRLRWLMLWIFVGVGMSGLLGWDRLHAEYHWNRARALETQLQHEAARQSLRKALAWFPPLEQLERTWLLSGKLDCAQRRNTPQARFLLAQEWADAPASLRLVQSLEDIARLEHPTHQGQAPRRTTEEFDPVFRARDELQGAEAMLDTAHPVLDRQLARVWAEIGQHYFQRAPMVTASETGRSRYWTHFHLMAAYDAWQTALRSRPSRYDCQLLSGMVLRRTCPDRPELLEAAYLPLLEALADNAVRAQLLNFLGDAWFEAGQVNQARAYYARSYETYCLPKFINFHAQKGLGGL
jgi:tetratricopeptide (TPR) repeat protein